MNKKNIFLILISFLIVHSALGRGQRVNSIKIDEIETFEQVKIEKGGMITLDQFFTKEKESSEDPYLIQFQCQRNSNKTQKTECQVVNYKLLKKIKIPKQ